MTGATTNAGDSGGIEPLDVVRTASSTIFNLGFCGVLQRTDQNVVARDDRPGTATRDDVVLEISGPVRCREPDRRCHANSRGGILESSREKIHIVIMKIYIG